ncbi:MAG: 50S ribosomal protein L24 [Firmicutes bacterium]|nr:50S ribosomal protein L24 [Bacillota bacterium]
MSKVHVKSGDRVKVLTGDSAGKIGKVLEVFPRRGKIIVDGVNIQKKHTRPTQTNTQGGIVEKPGVIDASNVALVCPSCNKATRVSRQRSEDGKLTRLCKKCGKAID